MRDISSPLDGFSSPFGPQRNRTLQSLLFGMNEPGFTFEPWDITTLYQDRAGTTPVTAAGQSVGLRLDKSGRGNHQTAINDSARGIYGWMPKTGRRNLLTYTEQFDNAVWLKINATVTANAAAAPDGTTTADALVQATGTRAFNVDGPAVSITQNGDKTLSVYAKQNTARYLAVGFSNGSGLTATAVFDLQTGLLSGSGFHPSVCTSITTAITSVGSGWYRCSLGLVGSTNSTNAQHIASSISGASGVYNRAITGDGTSGVYIWGAQLETGSTATAYQRVVSNYDITEAGVPTCYYVQADGVDDAYVTPTITPNTDKVQVFAGMKPLVVSASSLFLELSASGDANSGTFYHYFDPARGAASNPRIRGSLSTQTGPNPASITPPASSVYSATYDLALASNSITQRRNGAFDTTGGMVTQPGGNFLSYPAYIYARGGTAFPFNGLDFGHAVRFGPNLDAATIARVESLIARNTPEVTL